MGASSSFIVKSEKSSTGYTSASSDRSSVKSSNKSNHNANSSRHIVSVQGSVISNSLLDTCLYAWDCIDPPSKKTENDSKVVIFCQRFFQVLDILDVDQDVRAKFRPRRQSAILTRSGLLIRIVKYMLSVPSDSFKVKAKIRSLGRSHATRGIIEKHFKVFQEVFILCLEETLQVSADDPAIQAWTILLNFFVEQLTFDRVVFVSHHTSQDSSAPTNSAAEAMLLRSGSANTEHGSLKSSNNSSQRDEQQLQINSSSNSDQGRQDSTNEPISDKRLARTQVIGMPVIGNLDSANPSLRRASLTLETDLLAFTSSSDDRLGSSEALSKFEAHLQAKSHRSNHSVIGDEMASTDSMTSHEPFRDREYGVAPFRQGPARQANFNIGGSIAASSATSSQRNSITELDLAGLEAELAAVAMASPMDFFDAPDDAPPIHTPGSGLASGIGSGPGSVGGIAVGGGVVVNASGTLVLASSGKASPRSRRMAAVQEGEFESSSSEDTDKRRQMIEVGRDLDSRDRDLVVHK